MIPQADQITKDWSVDDHKSLQKNKLKTRPARLERATYGLEGRCSIQLSYGRLNGYSIPPRRALRQLRGYAKKSG
jgi:hypothetical protein